MLNKRVQILFDPVEYKKLQDIAKEKSKPVGALIREAVESLFFPQKKGRFDQLEAFGIWSKRKKSDKEILDELGRGWKDFHLNE